MSAMSDWFATHPHGLTAEQYDELPEEFSRRIEVDDGAAILTPSPLRSHQRVMRRLANHLEAAVGYPFEVDVDCDLRVLDLPLRVRRPDVVVYDARAMDDNEDLRPERCLLVVEVMSPGSVMVDRVTKAAEYAAAGIKHYWRIEDVDPGKRTMTVFRHRLDARQRSYTQVGIDTGVLSISDPFEVTIDLADLY